MARIKPFQGIHYNPSKLDLGDVLTPPYDVISKEEGKELLARSPYNYAHIILAKDSGNYEEVFRRLAKWREDQVLIQDNAPHFYIYQQAFKLDRLYKRNTLLCAVELSEFSEGKVRPHELTHSGPLADRLNILKQTQCNLSPIFAMVKDKSGVLETEYESSVYNEPNLLAKTADGITHSLWKVPEASAEKITAFFEDQPLYIVDGHHRYGSALAYAKEQNVIGNLSDSKAFMFFAIANVYDPALVVWPTHRLVRHAVLDVKARQRMEEQYRIHPISEGELSRFLQSPSEEPSFVICYQDEKLLCTPKDWSEKTSEWGESVASMSVAWSDKHFLSSICNISESERGDRITYHKDKDTLFGAMKNTDLGVILPPPEVESIVRVADENKFMPQKTTYFIPKLAAGLMIRGFA